MRVQEIALKTSKSHQSRREFALQTRSVCALVESLMPAVDTDDCWKILIECVHTVTRTEFCNLLGVYEIQVEREVEEFFALTDEAKKRWTLAVIKDGLKEICSQTGWQFSRFETAIRKAEELKLVNSWRWKRPITSPGGTKSAEIVCTHDITEFVIEAIVHDTEGRILARRLMARCDPDEFAFDRYLGNLEWESENVLALRGKDPEIITKIEIFNENSAEGSTVTRG